MPKKRVLVWVDRYQRGRPFDYLQHGATWPQGPLQPDAPYEAFLARQIAETLYRYIVVTDDKKPGPAKNLHPKKAQKVEKIAEETKMVRETIYNIRDGETWPDFITIARLEIYFKIRLWGNAHRENSP